ncbi:MAG: hypothetical protein PG981_000926 [Wolbachia endosymbiont of Ctenocephalides orientis wCori]|nr:MAG: hypothetical protein PG981_000926 [Wolbachia endosymbiont of Ctenocephalides orientis wCori]
MFRFLLIFLFFLLPGCGEYHCIKPESLTGLREKLGVVSTKQKWVDSGIYISDGVGVMEMNILPSKVNFCSNQYADFLVTNDISMGNNHTVSLPFALEKGDTISFSVVANKICKNNENDEKRYVKPDEKCNEKETEYFAKILNKAKCDHDGCPNKYIVGNAKWLKGREGWSSDFSKSDQDKSRGEIEDIIGPSKNVNCSQLSDTSKIDTYILNLVCTNMCYDNHGNCVESEFDLRGEELQEALLPVVDVANTFSNDKIVKEIKEKEKAFKLYIPSLKILIGNENLEHPKGFEHLKNVVFTNYNYEVKNSHPKGEKLTFTFNPGDGQGGYNMRVMKNPSTAGNLYISVFDKSPDRKPGENQTLDIAVDISKVYDAQYMEGIKEKLKGKTGNIYYGIRDHGCDYKNEGEFNIHLIIKEQPTKTFSAIYNFFDEKVRTAFFGSSYKDPNAIHAETSPVKSVYQSFVGSKGGNTIRSTIISLLLLYIVLYTLYYFLGLSHVSIYEFLIICVKIGTIATLLQDGSWNFFYNNAFSIFINTPKYLIEVANFRGTTSNFLEFLDLPLNRFLSSHSVMLMISLIFSGPLGVVSFCLVIWGLIAVSMSIFNALFSFISSIAVVALLLSLAPIFIVCLLFAYTRQMFQSWVRSLARFAIHPVILLIFISLISQVMDFIVYSVFDFEVCSTCIFSINLRIFNPCIIYGYASKHAPNVTAIMAFVILGHSMKALVKASAAISDSLCGVTPQNEPGGNYKQTMLGILGLDQESKDRREGGGSVRSPAAQSSRPQIPQQQRSGPLSAPKGPGG